MINRTQLNSYVNKLPSGLTGDELNWHKYIISQNFYGIDYFTSASDVLVLIGEFTGLEVLTAFYSYKERDIIIIEDDELKSKRITALLKKNVDIQSHVHLFATCDDTAVTEIIANRTVTVRIANTDFNKKTFEYILDNWTIDHICGEFNKYKIDPLYVYRKCAKRVDDFYFRMQDQPMVLSGSRQTYDYEVSVVVPVYNISDYVDQCIESLVNQTLQSLEILVVDDGTPDDSGQKADLWAEKYPGRVKVIHKPNGGCASARNAGVSQAKGMYIGFVDGDDWSDPQMYEDLFRAAVLKNADIAQCGYKEVYETGEVIKFPLNVHLTRHDLLRERPTMWRRIYSHSMLNNKSIVFPEHIRRFDDLPFQFETFLNAKVITSIPFSYYNYRQGRLGQDISVRDDRLYVHFPIFSWIYERNGQSFNFDEEKKLFELELDVHFWAWSVINDEFKQEYFKQVKQQIFGSKQILKKLDMLKIAKGRGRERFKFFCSLLTRR